MNTANPTSLLGPDHQSNSTFSVKQIIGTKIWSGRSGSPMKVIMVRDKNGQISYLPTLQNCIQNKESSNQQYIVKLSKQDKNIDENTLLKILKTPYFYIGIDKESYFIIKLLLKNMKIPSNHLLMCLKKIKLNNSFIELADECSLTSKDALKIFQKNVPVLAKIMRKFIVKLDFLRNISGIIDCLEIRIEKPSNALIQKQTWSEHKNANSIKYLLSCNPNGLINYVSTGYGGRITDTNLVEICGFTKHLQPRMSIMVNREFKNLEMYFQEHGVKFLRSSSVVEANGSIAGENTRIEKYFKTVMGRLQGFAMLRPNSCVNSKLVKVLDDVVSIASGLMNIQDNTQPTSGWYGC